MIKKEINVLITGVGAPGGVAILKALKHSNLDIRIVTADMNKKSVGLFFSNASYYLPSIKDKSYIERLVQICNKEKIDIVFIGSEPELRFILQHVNTVEAKTGAVFVISRSSLMEACLDKWEMTQLLNDYGFNCPQTTLASDKDGIKAMVSKFGFPLFLKPRLGSGSKSTFLIKNLNELKFFTEYVPDAVVQEWLAEDEQEYTVGVYVSSTGNVVGSIVCKRELAAGLTYRAFFDRYPEISQYCENVADVLKPLGPFNFQIRMHKKQPYIFEMNPRCSSTTVMRAVLGFNEPEMAILDLVLGQKIETPNIQYRTVFRYWDEAYIKETGKDSTYDDNGEFTLPNAITFPLFNADK